MLAPRATASPLDYCLLNLKGLYSYCLLQDVELFSSKDCVLACGPEKQCYPNTCCALPKNKQSNKGSAIDSPKANGTITPRHRLSNSDSPLKTVNVEDDVV